MPPSSVFVPRQDMPGTDDEKPFSNGPYRFTVELSMPATLDGSVLLYVIAAVSMHATDPSRAAALLANAAFPAKSDPVGQLTEPPVPPPVPPPGG